MHKADNYESQIIKEPQDVYDVPTWTDVVFAELLVDAATDGGIFTRTQIYPNGPKFIGYM
jgi:hypothetical protein